jgi:phage shock protein A
MGILGKIFTAVRGAASEAGEAIVDNQALRILDQEIREADQALSRSKTDLTSIIAQRRLEEQKLADIDRRIGEFEQHAASALAQGRDDLATEVATRIAELEGQRADADRNAATYRDSEGALRETIRKTETNLRRMKAQVDTVRATASVQRAQASIAAKHAGATSRMGAAMDSLERIKAKQAVQVEQFKAAEELGRLETGADLEAKLAAAGIGGGSRSAQSVLERIKAKALPPPGA